MDETKHSDDVLVSIEMRDAVTLGKLKKIVSSLEHDAREGAYHFVDEGDVRYTCFRKRSRG